MHTQLILHTSTRCLENIIAEPHNRNQTETTGGRSQLLHIVAPRIVAAKQNAESLLDTRILLNSGHKEELRSIVLGVQATALHTLTP